MASKSNLTLSNIIVIALVGIISASIFFASSSTNQFTGAATATEIAMPFPIDAWGYSGWGDCSTQDKGKTWANNYCVVKNYKGADSCYHEAKMERWKWDGAADSPKKGIYTASGVAFTKVKCNPNPSTTTKTVTLSGGANNYNSITLNFDKEYKNVIKIYVEGIPGGELCTGKVNIAYFRENGNVIENNLYTGFADAHKTAKKTFDIPRADVKKVIGTVYGDGNVLTPDCASLDYLKVTLTYEVTN